MQQKLKEIMFVHETMLITANEKDLQKFVNEFSTVYMREGVKVNESNGKR